jgi:bacterioferritin-associated ferredoxin
MIVCLCNGISERAACRIAHDGLCRNVNDIYRCLGCRVQCGKCVPELRRILESARATAPAAAAEAGPALPDATSATEPG